MLNASRRQICSLFASGPLLAGGLGGTARATSLDLNFPKAFVWGCSTAAYQIEGAVNEDGRGASIWDVFSHTPGKIANDETGDIACDSYHRFSEDSDLLRTLGARAYRFSIAWPRIFPNGRGAPNQKGIDHYARMIDDLLQKGIDPYVTLYHWDLPAALPNGWLNRDTSYAFADYASYVVDKFSDRVGHFITTNEFRSFIDKAYGTGKFAPGLRLTDAEVNQARHHALLAHGLGVQAMRGAARAETKIGLADDPTIPVPVIETADHIAAAKTAMRVLNGGYLTAVLEGCYHESYLESQGAAAPKIVDGDMKAIGSALDFVGLNVYTQKYVAADSSAPYGFAVVTPPQSYPKMNLSWFTISPEAPYWAARLTSALWAPKAIYISENGCPSEDKDVNGRIEDTDRIMLMRSYLTHLHRATAEGYPVRGYFVWSLMDNFEWASGFGARFGLYYMDYKTLTRIPKLSAAWYREVIRRNAVV